MTDPLYVKVEKVMDKFLAVPPKAEPAKIPRWSGMWWLVQVGSVALVAFMVWGASLSNPRLAAILNRLFG